MIDIVITSFKEPNTIGKAIEAIVSQKLPSYRLTICAPDEETLQVARNYKKRYKQIFLFKDPGKGKSFALNLLLPKLKGKIIILTDGDVFVGKNSINYLLEKFNQPKIGCVTGQPVSLNNRDNILGYWSHLLCFAAHKLREKRNKEDKFLECSGYLWGFRNGIIKKFPLHVPEDTIVPIMFWNMGFKIRYVPQAKVFVKFPNNIKDFIEQKVRTAKAHIALKQYLHNKKIPKIKSFKSEIINSVILFSYPKNFKEFLWTLALFPIRLYIWLRVFFEIKVKKEIYRDGWKRIESTK